MKLLTITMLKTATIQTGLSNIFTLIHKRLPYDVLSHGNVSRLCRVNESEGRVKCNQHCLLNWLFSQLKLYVDMK